MCEFVAEISSNHNQDLDRCRELIQRSAAIGCDAVKFQLFRVDQLFAPEVLARSEGHRARRAWELPVAWLPELARACHEASVAFICTPFDLEAVGHLAPLVDAFKIASYELLWHDLFRACAATGRPVVFSTGMATQAEIDAAVEVLGPARERTTILHCVSGYPVPHDQVNLATLATLRDRYGLPVGWSDHSVDPAVVASAVLRWDAAMVEFHIDLDGAGAEYGGGHCWLPDEVAPLIAMARRRAAIDGSATKVVSPKEADDRAWRADPSDGLRPLRATRTTYVGEDAS